MTDLEKQLFSDSAASIEVLETTLKYLNIKQGLHIDVLRVALKNLSCVDQVLKRCYDLINQRKGVEPDAMEKTAH